MVYTWGWGSIEREAREDYTIAGSLQEAAETMTSVARMELIHAESYAQPGYAEHPAPRCRLEHRPTAEHRWQPCPWPDTNAIWVLRAPDQDENAS